MQKGSIDSCFAYREVYRAMGDTVLKIVQTINSYLTDYVLIFLLVGCGLYFSVRTKFVQVRCFGEGIRNVFGKLSLKGGKHGGGMSSFQALATAIAAQVGTGNIVGASGAILLGGPGAIFWMWIIAFLGMATIYAEAVLAQKTRIVKGNGDVHGGPVYYIRTAFKGNFGKFLAGFFAVAIIIALGFFGCMVQSNSIGEVVNNAFNVPTWVTGLLLVAISAFIFLGGMDRLASVTEKIVPIMATFYLLGGIIIFVANITKAPQAFGLIFKYAFEPQAIIGGAFGAAIKKAVSQGAKRGLFSNEAGMGSTPHAHAQANVKDPHEQGTVAMIGVFIDTFVVLTITAITIVLTLYTDGGPLCNGYQEGMTYNGLTVQKTSLAQMAFGTLFGQTGGNIFIAIALFFFAYSTVLGWNMFGKINVCYLFGKNERREKAAVKVYTVIALAFIFLGTIASNDLVWELTDFFNYLMVLPNIVGLIACSGLVVSLTHFKDKNTLKIKE